MKPQTLEQLFTMDRDDIDFQGEGNLYDINHLIGMRKPWAPPAPMVWKYRDPDAYGASQGERREWFGMLETLDALHDEFVRRQNNG